MASVVGFVVPIYNTSKAVEDCGQCALKVTLTWDDALLLYTARVDPLTEGDVWQALSSVHTDQRQQLSILLSRANTHFTLPISERYVNDTFGSSSSLLMTTHTNTPLASEHM